jgi:signal transduction histidine kinase
VNRVYAEPHTLRTPLRHRVPPAMWTALAWSGAIAFPFVLFAALLNGAQDHAGLHGLRYLLPTLAVVLPAGLLRRAPLPALALMLIGLIAVATMLRSWEHGYLWDIRYLQVLAVDLAVGFIAAGQRRRISITAAVLALGTQGGLLALHPLDIDFLNQVPLPIALALVTAWVIGDSVRQRRESAEALRSQAVAQAIIAERLQIARELHDMVAHSIGVIAIQAGVGSRVIDTQPAEARNAMSAIETTSRETLAGLRRMLGALRQAEPVPGSHLAPLGPAPGLADVDRLVASTMRAGVRVDVQLLGRPRPIPADLDLSAFRVIQEAVTNVVRHAGTHDCRVLIDYRAEDLSIEVVDTGQGCDVAGNGYGLIGMRERVGLLHGQLTAGPRPEGGFQVAARFPMPAQVR